MLALLPLLLPQLAWANDDGHLDPVSGLVLRLAVILAAAKLGGHWAVRFKQPAVLGELLGGVLLGNIPFPFLQELREDVHVDMLARLGVLLLLFTVGLESTVAQMRKVGLSSLLVACVGVAVPFALGWGVGAVMLPGHSVYVHAFLGATLTATSVGITARVLKDLGRSQTPEARVILGAAVIDDVLGLVILAVVGGVIAAAGTGQSMQLSEVALILGKAVGFLVGALVLGVWVAPKLFHVASRLRSTGVLLATSLAFCFILSWLSNVIGLAPIVGAFAAGLVLEDVHFKDFTERGDHTLEELIHPIGEFLVPIFFVLMGMRTDLASFAQPGVLALAAALCVVAVLGKQLCGVGIVGGGINRVTVGVGMIPRGEVGLIFANIGMSLTVGGEHIMDAGTFSAVVIMVIVTTLVTPPALGWAFARQDAGTTPPAAPEPAAATH